MYFSCKRLHIIMATAQLCTTSGEYFNLHRGDKCPYLRTQYQIDMSSWGGMLCLWAFITILIAERNDEIVSVMSTRNINIDYPSHFQGIHLLQKWKRITEFEIMYSTLYTTPFWITREIHTFEKLVRIWQSTYCANTHELKAYKIQFPLLAQFGIKFLLAK